MGVFFFFCNGLVDIQRGRSRLYEQPVSLDDKARSFSLAHKPILCHRAAHRLALSPARGSDILAHCAALQVSYACMHICASPALIRSHPQPFPSLSYLLWKEADGLYRWMYCAHNFYVSILSSIVIGAGSPLCYCCAPSVFFYVLLLVYCCFVFFMS